MEQSIYRGVFLTGCLFLLCVACNQHQQPRGQNILTIDEVKTLDSIPSGSGLLVHKSDSAYVVGDDATSIFVLNLKNYGFRKIILNTMDSSEYREPKDRKHDFESACFADWNGARYLLAFGSGTAKKGRDSLLLMNISYPEDQQLFSLHQFYKSLQQQTKTDSIAWNIEGSVLLGDTLILLNRGNNTLISTSLKALLTGLQNGRQQFSVIDQRRIHLPKITGMEARLSGVCQAPDGNLLFSASVEDTRDWTKDGPVLGSYIVSYSLKENKVIYSYLLQGDDGKPMEEKLESLDMLGVDSSGNVQIVAIGDNDDGSSKIFRLTLSIVGNTINR